MKYQIYLNKETSIIVNDLAEKNKVKPNTFIKQFLEGFMKIYATTQKAVEVENEKALNRLKKALKERGIDGD